MHVLHHSDNAGSALFDMDMFCGHGLGHIMFVDMKLDITRSLIDMDTNSVCPVEGQAGKFAFFREFVLAYFLTDRLVQFVVHAFSTLFDSRLVAFVRGLFSQHTDTI